MFRSIVPFLLVYLGFTLLLLSRDMPLFDWEISDVVAEIPPEFHVKPSPWTTRLGEPALVESYDGRNYFPWQVYKQIDETDSCSPMGSKPIAKWSQFDKTLEKTSISFFENVYPWLWGISWFILFLCAIYIWWFTLWNKQPISQAVIVTVLATIMFCLLLVYIWHPLFARVGIGFPCGYGQSESTLSGTLHFTIQLSKVHYETLVTMLVGVCLELGTAGMLLQKNDTGYNSKNRLGATSCGLTQRALDAGESPHFSSRFFALAFSVWTAFRRLPQRK